MGREISDALQCRWFAVLVARCKIACLYWAGHQAERRRRQRARTGELPIGGTPPVRAARSHHGAVTARHDALLDAIIAAHGGTRVRERGEGDSIFAVFTRPDQAMTAALAMTRAVLAEPWPAATPFRVRMRLHTGSAQLRAGGYYGPVVNRCARIRG